MSLRRLISVSCNLSHTGGLSSRSPVLTFLPCRTMASFEKMKFWKKSETSDEVPDIALEESKDGPETYERELAQQEKEAMAEFIESKRLKSKLSASHRQILMGEPPHEGHLFEYTAEHKSKEFKRSLLSKYGRRKTGVSPSQCWPTDKELELAQEWERLYQEQSLRDLISQTRKNIEDRRLARLQREEEVDKNLAKMELQIKQWRDKQGAKTRLQDAERERRERILAELKLEFGYNVNPEDNYMKERIETREKAIIKEERAAKAERKKEMKKNK